MYNIEISLIFLYFRFSLAYIFLYLSHDTINLEKFGTKK